MLCLWGAVIPGARRTTAAWARFTPRPLRRLSRGRPCVPAARGRQSQGWRANAASPRLGSDPRFTPQQTAVFPMRWRRAPNTGVVRQTRPPPPRTTTQLRAPNGTRKLRRRAGDAGQAGPRTSLDILMRQALWETCDARRRGGAVAGRPGGANNFSRPARPGTARHSQAVGPALGLRRSGRRLANLALATEVRREMMEHLRKFLQAFA